VQLHRQPPAGPVRPAGGRRPFPGAADHAGLLRRLQEPPPRLAPGQREIAIMVDAETGVAGKIHPNSVVDIIATYAGGQDRPDQAEVVVPGARVIDVGVTVSKNDGKVQQQDAEPQSVVPVTFALTPEQDLAVTHAETFASEVRLALLRPGDLSELTSKQRTFTRKP